jgi:tyrosyl-tRNA synthetase
MARMQAIPYNARMTNEELLTRAVSDVVPRKVAEGKLKGGKPLRMYWGIDPTGAKIHLGHSVPLRKMRAFQDAGHHVILLIGSFTAMVGDPSGRDEMRQPLTAEDVKKNFETYIAQAGKILDMKKLEVRYNHEWLEKLSFKDILGLTSHFTVQQMLHRDMFQKRMEEDAPISLTEFMYPLMVGYDSVILDVDVELGGNDQLFNMLAGRTLQTAYGKRDKFVLTTKIVDGTDGRKMSKSFNNCVYLDDEPNDMYGKLLSMPDHLIPLYMECCTGLPMAEVKACEKALKEGKENPKTLKMRLAREIVTMYHSADAAAKAEANFENLFKNKGVPEDMPQYKAKKGESLIDALVASKTVASKSEARRLIEQGGVKVNDKPVTSVDTKAEEGIVKVGKRKFVRVVS